MSTKTKLSPGKFASLLVCGESLGGSKTADTVYVHITPHTMLSGTLGDAPVFVWNGKSRFVETRKKIVVVDLR